MNRAELRHVRFVQEQFPELYDVVFGGVMGLTHPETEEQGRDVVAEICLEVGKVIVLNTADRKC